MCIFHASFLIQSKVYCMKRLPLPSFTVICTAFFILIFCSAAAQFFTEIIGRPTDSSISINFLADQNTDVYWEYGTSPGSYSLSTTQFAVEKDSAIEVDFTNLLPDTKYFYRTRYRAGGSSTSFLSGTEHHFNTQRASGSTFTFTIEADEHLYDKKGVCSLHQVCIANQATDDPDFMLTLGDIFGDDHHPYDITASEMDSLHKFYRPYLGSICHSVPLFICLGNHEGEKDFYLHQTPPENIAVYATLSRKSYYPNPSPNNFYSGNPDTELFGMGNPENYYAWTWGNALFVVLDVYRYDSDTSAKPTNWEWTLGFPQYTWLKNTLELSDAQYKFVFAHHTRGEGRGGITTARYFEWGGYEANGTTWGFSANRPGWVKPIHQLFVDNGVNIFFQGHDHLFAHEVLDGVVYQEVPMPSDSTYEIGMLANAGAYVSDTIGGSGHLKVTVSPSCVQVDFIRAYLPADTLNGNHHNREVAFSYTIGTCPSQGIDDQIETPIVNVFPNPVTDKITISLSEDIKHFQISLINTLGQVLLQTQSKTVDVGRIQNGIYFLHVRAANFDVKKKLIIYR